MPYVFPPPSVLFLPVFGSEDRFPLRRVFCIGRNYADHAKEMGAEINRAEPVFFLKPADAVVPQGGQVPYPSCTHELHHEVEMVVALHQGGQNIAEESALECVYGYAVGLDLTRRDLQAKAKAKGLPWDVAKAFDYSAPVSALRRASEIGHPCHAQLSLSINGTQRQAANIDEMLLPVSAIIGELSKLFELKPGDLIFTGTPAGVAALARGDYFRAELENIAVLEGEIV